MTAIVRVVDANLYPEGPVSVVLTGPELGGIADAVSTAGALVERSEERLSVMARASQVVDAAGRTGGAAVAEPLREELEAAIAAWRGELVPAVDGLELPEHPVVMGVVNVTPDSFSDGGAHVEPDAAVAHGVASWEAGASLVDVGGESTRPGADPVDLDTELQRVLPVVEGLVARGVRVSIDTTRSEVARVAVGAGAVLVNDTSAGRDDRAMLPTVAELGVPYVIMHRRGMPATMQDDPVYDDVVAEVHEFLASRLAEAERRGVESTRVLLDPGFGFGKTAAHNLALLRHLRQLTSLGRPLLVGLSRKSFLGALTGIEQPAERDGPSAVAAALAVTGGARVVRAHDVGSTLAAVDVAQAVT